MDHPTKRQRLNEPNDGDSNSYEVHPHAEDLGKAAIEGNYEAVRLFLDKGTLVNTATSNYDTVLHAASALGHLEVTKLLIARGAPIIAPNTSGVTPLMLAASNGHVDIVKLLLDKGAEESEEDLDEALWLAVQNGHAKVIKKLLERGANVNLEDCNGCTLLMIAVQFGHAEAVAVLFDNLASRTTTGDSLLGIAVREGHVHVARTLLDLGHLVDKVGIPRGLTELFRASLAGQLEMVRLLLDRGANPEFQPKQGTTPLFVASTLGFADIVSLLCQRGARFDLPTQNSNTPIHSASIAGHAGVVKVLLGVGVPVDAKNNSGATPLLLASAHGHAELVTLLLDWGADVNTVSTHGYTPLCSATLQGHADVLVLLLEHGAIAGLANALSAAVENGRVGLLKLILRHRTNVDLDSGTETLLYKASVAGNLEMVTILLAHGASVNEPHSNIPLCSKYRPLYGAAAKGHLEVVHALLDHGAEVEICSLMRMHRPLYVAAEQGYLDVVHVLLDNGAAVYSQSAEGQTPLHAAVKNNHLGVIELLLDRGASLTTLNSARHCPLSVAALQGHLDAARLLLHRGANFYTSAPLCVAAKRGDLEMMKLFLRNRANIDGLDRKGYTALYYACSKGQAGVVKFLLERGATVEQSPSLLAVASQNGFEEVVTLLMEGILCLTIRNAAEGGQVDLVKKLLAKRNKDILGTCSITPMMVAARFRQLDVVKLLLDEGETLDELSCKFALSKSLKSGRLELAELLIQTLPQGVKEVPNAIYLLAPYASARSSKTLELLIQNGADINWTDDDGQSALHIAWSYNSPKMMWQLVLHGADTSAPFEGKSLWQLCEGNKAYYEVLTHFWSPQTHKYHPRWVRDALKCVLLIAKQQNWPFDELLMHKLLSHVAYGWYKQ